MTSIATLAALGSPGFRYGARRAPDRPVGSRSHDAPLTVDAAHAEIERARAAGEDVHGSLEDPNGLDHRDPMIQGEMRPEDHVVVLVRAAGHGSAVGGVVLRRGLNVVRLPVPSVTDLEKKTISARLAELIAVAETTERGAYSAALREMQTGWSAEQIAAFDEAGFRKTRWAGSVDAELHRLLAQFPRPERLAMGGRAVAWWIVIAESPRPMTHQAAVLERIDAGTLSQREAADRDRDLREKELALRERELLQREREFAAMTPATKGARS